MADDIIFPCEWESGDLGELGTECTHLIKIPLGKTVQIVIFGAIGTAKHRQLDCLYNSFFGLTTKKTRKLCITNPLWEEFTDQWWIPSHKAPVMRKVLNYVFSIPIQIQFKIHSVAMHSLVIISLQVTVETMTAQLSCHVQNYGDHFVRTFGDTKMKFPPNLNRDKKIFGSQVPISRFMSSQSKSFCKNASCTFAQNKDPIRSQFCTCHDNKVILTYAIFSHDRII